MKTQHRTNLDADIVGELLNRILEDDAGAHTIDVGHALGDDTPPMRLVLVPISESGDGCFEVEMVRFLADREVTVGTYRVQIHPVSA